MLLQDRVICILKDLSGLDVIETNNSLVEDLGLDSFYMVTLLIEIEDNFNIELSESDMNPFDLSTVQDVVDLVKKYCGDEYE